MIFCLRLRACLLKPYSEEHKSCFQRYVLIVGNTIPVINMQSHLINKIPSYFPIRHKKYIFALGCDLVVSICYDWRRYNNCITIVSFPPVDHRWLVNGIILWKAPGLFKWFHLALSALPGIWGVLAVCKSWFDEANRLAYCDSLAVSSRIDKSVFWSKEVKPVEFAAI